MTPNSAEAAFYHGLLGRAASEVGSRPNTLRLRRRVRFEGRVGFAVKNGSSSKNAFLSFSLITLVAPGSR